MINKTHSNSKDHKLDKEVENSKTKHSNRHIQSLHDGINPTCEGGGLRKPPPSGNNYCA